MIFVTVILTSNEAQRVQKAASALWPEEIRKGRLSLAEIVRRFTCAGSELLARLSDQERKKLQEKFIDSVSTTKGFYFKGRLPRG